MEKEDDQLRLDGSTLGNNESGNSTKRIDDFGQECPYWKTFGGHRRDTINSLMQKAVRRSQPAIAEFCAFEMTRSGFGQNCLNRLTLYLVEDIAAGEEAVLTVPPLLKTAQRAGVGSRVGQVAAMKAARICAEAWSSREAVHADDFFRHVAELRAEHDESAYDFPIQPGNLDNELSDQPDQVTDGQMTFVDDGDLEPDVQTNDYGEVLSENETLGGYHSDGLLNELGRAIENEDIERACFVAWELVRSGYDEGCWGRIAEIGISHTSYDSPVPKLIDQYETLATERWNPDDWEGRLCAIHAAITVIRSVWSSETVDRCEELHELAEQRAAGDAEFPVEPDEIDIGERFCVAADKHTRPGGWADRGWKEFWLKSARVGPEGEPAHSCRWQRARLEMEVQIYRGKFQHVTQDQIEHALSPVSATNPWGEDREAPNSEIDDFTDQ
jgi:hypothetical protein